MSISQGPVIRPPIISRRSLNPIERVTEILFGLIMALSFTCALSIYETDRAEIRQMLIGVIGCNIAWGIIDAIMYLMIVMVQRRRDISILNFIKNSNDQEKAKELITECLSPEIAAGIGTSTFENIRLEIARHTTDFTRPLIFRDDIKAALGVFLLVFMTTIPVALPFAFLKSVPVALRTSNGIAIILLFFGGMVLARYSGFRRYKTGLCFALIGAGMVFLTISLGG